MADSTLNVRLLSAYKTSAQWTNLNPVLHAGEVGYESDTGGLFKIGNGTSTWNQLPYSNHRPLTNNDFDTANITDANVGNLIVTGAARFLNTIQGTAADSDKLGGQGSAYYATTAGYGASLGTASNEITLKNGAGTTISHITVPYATSAGAAPYPVVGVTASNYLTATTSNKVVNIKHDDTLSATGSITAGTAGTADAWGESISFTIPEFNYNKGGHLTSASSKSFKVSIPSTSGLATTGYVNERVANAVHFISGFNPSNADALKAPVKEKGDMYVATAAGTFYGLELEIGDSIIFQITVAANTNPTSADFIGVEKTVSVTNNNPQLGFNASATVGNVEGKDLTLKMPSITGDSWITTGGSATALTLSHAGAQASAGGAGPTANVSPSFGGSFTVPYIAWDSKGHVKTTANRTITLPSSSATWTVDENVKQTATTAKTYLIGNAGSATTTSGCNLSTAVYMSNGNMTMGGALTLGGNNAGTTGCTLSYSTATKSLDFIFA